MNRKKVHRKRFDVQKFKEYLFKQKIVAVSIIAVILLECVSILISYAFYNVTKTEPIIGGKVGEIADLNVQIMVQNRDEKGNAIDGYALYPYIPQAGYVYNAQKSYCTNGANVNFENGEATIVATRNDICYLYFDASASLDIALNIYKQEVDESGKGIDKYMKLESGSLPISSYVLNRFSCKNNSIVTYDIDKNMFSVEASGKDICDVYMDIIDTDIALKVFAQEKKGLDNYLEVSQIPNNVYYTLNDEMSKCIGDSDLSLESQKVVVSAKDKTSCEAYLDISSGPIIDEINYTNNNGVVTLLFKQSNSGTLVKEWKYSVDGGRNYISTSDLSVEIPTSTMEDENIFLYAVDYSDKSSAIISVNSYFYSGSFDYANDVQTKQIDKEGYYKLEVWGASSDISANEKGGYSSGIIHLNAGDILYIHTGSKNDNSDSIIANDTEIRVNQDDVTSRVIAIGTNDGANYTYTHAIENSGLDNTYYLLDVKTNMGGVEFLSPYGIKEVGHSGNGYAKVTYISDTLE